MCLLPCVGQQNSTPDPLLTVCIASTSTALRPVLPVPTAKLAHPRSDCCAAAIGGKLLVAGGWSADYADTLGSVEAYDPGADAFSRMPNLTLARGDCEAAVIDDRWAGGQAGLKGCCCDA